MHVRVRTRMRTRTHTRAYPSLYSRIYGLQINKMVRCFEETEKGGFNLQLPPGVWLSASFWMLQRRNTVPETFQETLRDQPSAAKLAQSCQRCCTYLLWKEFISAIGGGEVGHCFILRIHHFCQSSRPAIDRSLSLQWPASLALLSRDLPVLLLL